MRGGKPVSSEPTKVTVDDVFGRLERSESLFFVDARSPKAWEESDVKLPGALRVPPGETASHLRQIPRDRAIVVYCTWPHEASSARVAEEIAARGFWNVHVLYGGFDTWTEAGYPVEPK